MSIVSSEYERADRFLPVIQDTLITIFEDFETNPRIKVSDCIIHTFFGFAIETKNAYHATQLWVCSDALKSNSFTELKAFAFRHNIFTKTYWIISSALLATIIALVVLLATKASPEQLKIAGGCLGAAALTKIILKVYKDTIKKRKDEQFFTNDDALRHMGLGLEEEIFVCNRKLKKINNEIV